ncbi:hypothetical protein AN958_10371 [Leucoagaricus sp. SymC.cos]|nr:hypothetical protein AN958_10371 [Leucoagaricus sp. SymC.cos]
MIRLNGQHRMILQLLDDTYIHVPLELSKPGAVILGSAAGTGIWLVELSKLIPTTVELIGIDIVDKLFPGRETLPSNVTFQITSILNLPVEWTSKFDLVNKRLLIAGLRHSEWITAINNMYHALKQGGWIQLYERNGSSGNLGPIGKKISLLHQSIMQSQGIVGTSPNTGEVLKRMAEEARFVEIKVTYYEKPIGKWAGEDGIKSRYNSIQLFRGLKGLVLENEGFRVEIDEGMTKPESTSVLICARKLIDEYA